MSLIWSRIFCISLLAVKNLLNVPSCNIAETYKVATIAVCSCEVCLVIVYLNRCIRYATNWNNLARKTLFAVLRLPL